MKIKKVIKEFKKFDKDNVLIKTFTQGFCYDFACILKMNFPKGEIYFIKNRRHYVFKINNKFYDITGEVNIKKEDILEKDTI
jgi:hypothetical protein